ncbi:cell wall hydrolase [Brevundimonas sp. BAL450]|nr:MULTISPECIES: cell wall hydrolase [Brevundimonas]MBG7614248.1 cell wall hydrolase [Brevundimonas sp. BAL450]
MRTHDVRQALKRTWRIVTAAPVVVGALALAMSASSTVRPESDRTAEGLARLTQGQLNEAGLLAVSGRLDPATLALAQRHDPAFGRPGISGLTPGWESLTLNGRPRLDGTASGADARRLNAAMAAEAGALRPARPFVFNAATAEDRRRAQRCLTQAVYYEAALESTLGQEAVAQVVLNRVRDPNYPNTVCGVVFEGAERTTGCQFSFTCDGSLAQGPVGWAWRRAEAVAQRALAGHVAAEVGTATHYHADYVYPWWAPTVTKIRQIGAHIFYRWNGALGDTAAFIQAHAGREPVIDEARFSRPRFQTAAAGESLESLAEASGAAPRTVEINGATRVVGVISLGGRRQPTAEEVAAINARLADFEDARAAPAEDRAPPPGVTVLDVEEVGRPGA